MTAPIGIAVVGLGLAGGAMVPVIRAHPGFRLVAAVDPIADLRQTFGDQERLPAFATLDELWNLTEVQAVYLATPHEYHRDQTLVAAAAGRHVIVEKPMALTIADCDAMVDACDDAHVELIVGHTHGFDPAVRAIAEEVRAESYGKLGMISMWNYTDFLYRPRRPEELDENRGGGILFNQLPHQVDVIRTIFDRPVHTVRAITSTLDPDRPVAGSCAAVLELEGGVAASIVYSGYDQFDTDELDEWTSEGGGTKHAAHGTSRRGLAAMSAGDEVRARTTAYAYGYRQPARPARQPHFGELVVTCAKADLRPRPDGVMVYGHDGTTLIPAAHSVWSGRGDVLDELCNALTTGQSSVHNGRFGRETVRICRAIADSSQLGREIYLETKGVEA